ncbi:MAG TPA: hypothetical protein VMU53_02010 [Candidatus Sulfotelmatobacter sp.]|nr:hypothetical protein [Candidatus Sulfotelmatobacter sp.]
MAFIFQPRCCFLENILLFSSLLFATAVGLFSPQTVAQTVNCTGFPQWDSTNQVLFCVNGSPGVPIRAYTGKSQRGADIDVFKDFPDLQEYYGTSVTAGPNGTTLIATILNFGDHNVREVVLTYDSTGQLLKTWDPAPQYVEALAYSKDDDALFVLGSRNVPNVPDAPDYPLLVEYTREGRVLREMVPASTLEARGDSFNQGGETGQPALRVTKNHIFFYAPTNREVVMLDRTGAILARRTLNDIVGRLSTEDGYHLAQTHAIDFSNDGDIVLELLLGNDSTRQWGFEVVRINVKTGEAASVRKALHNDTSLLPPVGLKVLSLVGLKDGQYLYLEDSKNLYIQSSAADEPVPYDASH